MKIVSWAWVGASMSQPDFSDLPSSKARRNATTSTSQGRVARTPAEKHNGRTYDGSLASPKSMQTEQPSHIRSGPEVVLRMQRAAGNAAICQLLQRNCNAALQRQTVDFELEVPTESRRAELRHQGVTLPQVSAGSADPKRRGDYVDARVNAVGYGIYLGGFILYLAGVRQPIFVPEDHFDFAATNMEAADMAIFATRSEALRRVPMGPWPAGRARPYSYYWGTGGVVAPTVFSPDTTPRVIDASLRAQRELIASVQHELAVVAMSIVGGMALRAIINRLFRIGSGPTRPPARPPREIGEELVGRAGGSVRRAIADLNRMGLSQEDVAEAIEAMYRATGRDVSNRVRLPDGRLIITSRRLGADQPVNIVTPQGQASFGRATLSASGDLQAPISVSNVTGE